MVHGFLQFISRESLEDKTSDLIVNDKLTILCTVTIFQRKVRKIQYQERPVKLSKEFERLFETKKFSDVTLIADNQKFQSHKVVLASQSAVFSAMFEHDMKEKNSNLVEISDINPEVLQEMLRFVYSGKVKNMQKLAKGLFVATDKYAIHDFKNVCEDLLCDNIAVDTAVDILIFADSQNADILKEQAMCFITNNIKEVTLTTGYNSLEDKHN